MKNKYSQSGAMVAPIISVLLLCHSGKQEYNNFPNNIFFLVFSINKHIRIIQTNQIKITSVNKNK